MSDRVHAPDRAPRLGGWVPLLAVVLLWGTGPLAIGTGVNEGWGPLWLGGSRLVVAGLVLLVVSLARGEGVAPGAGFLRPILAGLMGWSLGNGLQVVAQTSVTSSLAALVIGLSPALALLLDAAVRRRLPPTHHLLAVGLGLAGLFILVGDAGGGDLWGIGLLFLAALAWSLTSVMLSHRPIHASPIVSAGWQMLSGGTGLLLAGLMVGEALPTPSLAGWASWVWLTLACATVGFLAWVQALRRVPVVVAMTQPTLSTLVAVGLGAVVLREPLADGAGLGVVLTLVGAALTLVPRDVTWPRPGRGLLIRRTSPVAARAGRGRPPRRPRSTG